MNEVIKQDSYCMIVSLSNILLFTGLFISFYVFIFSNKLYNIYTLGPIVCFGIVMTLIVYVFNMTLGILIKDLKELKVK